MSDPFSSPAPAATQPAAKPPVATWRKVLAAILDFLMVFAVGSYVIGKLTGNLVDGGFKLEGAPALVLFAVIALYFVIFRKFLGGTLWQRVLGARCA